MTTQPPGLGRTFAPRGGVGVVRLAKLSGVCAASTGGYNGHPLCGGVTCECACHDKPGCAECGCTPAPARYGVCECDCHPTDAHTVDGYEGGSDG